MRAAQHDFSVPKGFRMFRTAFGVLLLWSLPLLSTVAAELSVSERMYGTTASGEEVKEYLLQNEAGIEARLISYGATLTSLRVPDRDGVRADVVLGYDDLAAVENDGIYSGCIVGRFANRISGAAFTLDGKEYPLAENFSGGHHLHGGEVGFNSRVWQAEKFSSEKQVGVIFRLLSADGEEGYPGALDVVVTYSLNNRNELAISYQAETTRATHLNLTQHSYFNLAGHDAGSVHGHHVQLHCRHYLPVDGDGVPTGEIRKVAGTPFDFRTQQEIGAQVDQGRYDHCYVLARKKLARPRALARVVEPTSGRVMEVFTDQPGVQFYTSIHMTEVKGRGGAVYRTNQALCLETQHFPDTPNKPNFPSTVLRPGKTFRSTTIHRFSTQ